MAGYLRHDFDCHIYSWNADGTPPSVWMESQARDNGATLIPLSGKTIDEANADFTARLDATTQRVVTILDNYYFDTDYQRSVRSRSRALICLDDVHDRHFAADYVISFCPLDREFFSLEPYTRLFTGFQWSFLREPFFAKLPPAGMPRESLVMAIGGADPEGLTEPILRAVRDALPDVPLEVIAGETVRLSSEVDAMPRVIVHRRLDATQMVDVMDRAKMGLFPASTICMEAFSRKLPVAAGFFTGNQLDVYAAGVRRNLFIPLGDLHDPDINALVRAWSNDDRGTAEMPDFGKTRRMLVTILNSIYDEP